MINILYIPLFIFFFNIHGMENALTNQQQQFKNMLDIFNHEELKKFYKYTYASMDEFEKKSLWRALEAEDQIFRNVQDNFVHKEKRKQEKRFKWWSKISIGADFLFGMALFSRFFFDSASDPQTSVSESSLDTVQCVAGLAAFGCTGLHCSYYIIEVQKAREYKSMLQIFNTLEADQKKFAQSEEL